MTAQSPPADIPVALTVAGSDSSGGAGIQADLKTFAAFNVYGMSVVTALTAQNTCGVEGVHAVPAQFVTRQFDTTLRDIPPDAVKLGMLATAEIIEAVAGALERWAPLTVVADPVMVATSGDSLLAEDAENALRRRILPLAHLITPNLAEAARLLGRPVATSIVEMEDQGRDLLALGPDNVLMKGGHGQAHNAGTQTAVDVLVTPSRTRRFEAPWIVSKNTHGTGCTLSAAIASGLAKDASLENAIAAAKQFTSDAIAAARTSSLGSGAGPLIHNRT